MSVELENEVREILKEAKWTRAGIADFSKNDLAKLDEILVRARNESCETAIRDIAEDQLSHSKDGIEALYLAGMIALRQGSIDLSSLQALFDIFANNHKESLVESICEGILESDDKNKFAIHRLAEIYKNSNNDKVWDLYERIIKIDIEDAEVARALAERYELQGNREASIKYYKKALLRYVANKNNPFVKTMWTKLVQEIPQEYDFFMMAQRKVTASISAEKASLLMQELYPYYKDTGKWDRAIEILKFILSLDKKDKLSRKELVECYRGKYASHTHLDDYIRSANLNSDIRDVFEAINDFEKHISFDAKSFVFHNTMGVGIIKKVEGDHLTINFGKRNGAHTMSLQMAVKALVPLSKEHIWVQKATRPREELSKEVKNDVEGTLKKIIKSFDNNCDEKRIKAELVP